MAKVRIRLLLDESGSMGGKEVSVIEGANEFIGKLQDTETKDDVLVTLGKFDSHGGEPTVRYLYDDVPLDQVTELSDEDYAPRGMTPLNDALNEQIVKVRKAARKKDRVMYVVVTDGKENASELKDISTVVREEEKRGGEFIYLGANVDQFQQSAKLGMSGKRGSVALFKSSEVGTSNAMSMAATRGATFATSSDLYAATADCVPAAVADTAEDYAKQDARLQEAIKNASNQLGTEEG